MKLNNKKTGIACMIGVAVLASSCSDWLDPKPLSFYTPEISFTDYNGLKTGTDMLNRDVRYFDFYPTSGSADPCILSEYFFSDISVNGRTDAANSPQDLVRQITPSASLTGNASQINNYWTYLYKGIKDANTLLTRSETAEFDNEDQRKEIEGLACFHRAYRYYRLVNQYGDIPFITEEITGPRYDFYSTKREAILRYLKNDLDRTAPYLKNNVYIGMVTQAAAYHFTWCSTVMMPVRIFVRQPDWKSNGRCFPGLQKTARLKLPTAKTDLPITMQRKIPILSNMVVEYVQHVLPGIIRT